MYCVFISCKFTIKLCEYFQIIIPKEMMNCKVYVFLSLFIKFSAMGLHQDIRNDIIS